MSEQKERLYGARKYSEILTETAKYVDDRRKGNIKSLLTPWPGLNKAGVNGIEWGSLITIGARPGAGKTLIVSQILREARKLNPGQDFNILEFQFEMGAKQSGSRAFAAETALDYNQILSTTQALDDYSYNLLLKYIKETELLESQGIHRLQINNPINNREIVDAIKQFYVALGSKPLIVTIDHSWLIKKAPDEREKIATLYNTVEALMQVKKELPVIIFMVTQLNRTIDEPSRKEPGKIGNYPVSSDVFGGDALMQGSDMLLALNNPHKANIPLYGPKEYDAKKNHIFMHLLKVRNGSDDNNLLFMDANFNRQKLIEVAEFDSQNPTGTYQRRSARNQTAGQQFTTNQFQP